MAQATENPSSDCLLLPPRPLSPQERGDELLMRWRLQRAAGISADLRLPEDIGQ